ncbi:DoxX family protein [Mesorhizobium sp. M1340]|uniref:DoxX family protein n=1 Tax=unclassified Mesorhizobium TaxID=325217 RepID=UPI00333B230D
MIAFLPPRVGFARRRLDLGGRRACPPIPGDCSVPGRAGLPAPKPLLAAGSVLEIAGGFCLATGLGGRFPAAALAVFTITASFMALNFWSYRGDEPKRFVPASPSMLPSWAG